RRGPEPGRGRHHPRLPAGRARLLPGEPAHPADPALPRQRVERRPAVGLLGAAEGGRQRRLPGGHPRCPRGQLGSGRARTQTGDQRLVAALEADLGARYCVDRSRIYAAGISLGSEFSTIVACDPADHIAAVGLVAAEYLLRPCPGPVPVIAFHGPAAPIVPYATGATGRSVPGVPVVGAVQNLEAWARLDGCRPAPEVDAPASGIIRRIW